MSRFASPLLRLAVAPLALAALGSLASPARTHGDHIKKLQTEYATHPEKKVDRVYHWGSQGPGDVFSNHRSHSNRFVPVYVWGKKADLGSITGSNSSYRDAEKVEKLYGFLPENTVNPEAEYGDQSELYKVMADAIDKGVKHLFIVWFDGFDWVPTQAATIVKNNKAFTEGKGEGLIFQDYEADGSAQYGWVVTSPTYDGAKVNVDTQTVEIPEKALKGGYDVEIAGPNPWTLGPLADKAPGYLKGQAANEQDRKGVKEAGRVLHAYTDSATSAAEAVNGVKSYNNSINVGDDGEILPTIFHELQEKGWKVGTVTSVLFPHASPAAMYARNVHRNDYQDIARDMLGLPSIMTEARGAKVLPGLDVVIGTGYGYESGPAKAQGENAVAGNQFLAPNDRATIDAKFGGKYVVVETDFEADGAKALNKAAKEAVEKNKRLFGFFGYKGQNHLPYQTADGNFDPSPDPGKGDGKPGNAESYTKEQLRSQPTLADMTDAALTVLAQPDKNFALFIEAGDVDFALHANNLDNAIGAVYSGEDAIKRVIHWVEKNSNWDDSMVLISSDHGHYLVINDPEGLVDPNKK